jgi:hypothetical protein
MLGPGPVSISTDGKDTALSKGYSIASVDAFLPWIDETIARPKKESAEKHLFYGLSTEDAEAIPFFQARRIRDCFFCLMPGRGCVQTLQLVSTVTSRLFDTNLFFGSLMPLQK